MVLEVEESKTEFQDIAKTHPEQGGFAWLTDNEHNDMDAMFLKLRMIKMQQF